MMRIYIAQDPRNERWLMLVLRHHMTGDHTSSEVMQRELDAYLHHDGEPLPAPLLFRNVVAQARLAAGTRRDEAHFRTLLGDVDEPTAPFGLLNVRGDGSAIGQARMPVDPAIARRMRAAARTLGVSVASLCHVAWARVVARLSGRDDVVFGTALLGRMQAGEGSERGMGMMMNTLPVRITRRRSKRRGDGPSHPASVVRPAGVRAHAAGDGATVQRSAGALAAVLVDVELPPHDSSSGVAGERQAVARWPARAA